jgi:hypothetical protein
MSGRTEVSSNIRKVTPEEVAHYEEYGWVILRALVSHDLATVHHGWMIHGGPQNTTDRHRWGYILEYMIADTRFFYDGDQRRTSGMNAIPGREADHPIV